MQEARAGLHERAGGLERVVRVDGLVVEVALAQPHGLAVADVHRRQEDHAARGASETKFSSSRRPSGPDFSGWNCSAVDAAPAPPRSRTRCRTRRCRARRPARAGRGANELHVVEGARRRQPLGQRAARAASSPGSSRSAAPSGRARRAPPPARAAARSPPPRRARWCDSNSSCMPMQMPITGTPASTRSRSSSSSAELAHALHRLRHRAHARAARPRRPRARARGRA